MGELVYLYNDYPEIVGLDDSGGSDSKDLDKDSELKRGPIQSI